MPNCSSCQTSNSPEAKFCMACAAPLPQVVRTTSNNTRLQRFAGFLGVFAIVLFAIYIAYQAGKVPVAAPISPTQSSFPPAPRPVMQWVLLRNDNLGLEPGRWITDYAVPQGTIFRPKITISARSPVTLAWITAADNDDMVRDPVETAKRPIFHCLRNATLQTTVECPLDNSAQSYFLYIRDERLLGFTRNDIHITYLGYQCVSNCQQ